MCYYFHISSFVGEKTFKINLKIQDQNIDSYFVFVLLKIYRLTYQKPFHFLSAQMALVNTFFGISIVLGMYNFHNRLNMNFYCALSYFDFLFVLAMKIFQKI